MQKNYFGIDVDSENLVVAYTSSSKKVSIKNFKNTLKGITSLLKWARTYSDPHLILEATGTYSKRLFHTAVAEDIAVSQLTPSQGRSIGVLLKKKNKTDEEDARSLLTYGQLMSPLSSTAPSEKQEQVRQLISYISYLQKEKTKISNKLHALSFEHFPCAYVIKELEQAQDLKDLKLEEALEKLKKLKGKELEPAIKLAETVTGIGYKTAMYLMLLTGGLDNFTTAAQLVCFVGVCPTRFESGKSTRKSSHISKKGSKILRALLYMCARSARIHNPGCKDLYDRLRAKGKCHKAAMVAVGHKLLRQVFAVVKNKVAFDKKLAL